MVYDNLGLYSPKMKGANWLKLICHQGRSLGNIFSQSGIFGANVWYSLILLHNLVCQMQNKQMSQLVAYSGNICVECGGGQLRQRSANMVV